MKNYIGTKAILAKPMTRGEYNEYRGWETPEDEVKSDEGFLVEYLDSPEKIHDNHEHYISWSPKDVFDRAYHPTSGLTFGFAIDAMRMGKKVTRSRWNGKGMYLWMVLGATVEIEESRNLILKDIAHESEDGTVTINAHIDMKTADGTVLIGWSPNQLDMLSVDWNVLE